VLQTDRQTPRQRYDDCKCRVIIASRGKQEGLAVANIVLDDLSPLPGMHHDPMHFRHRQTDRHTDADIVA